MKMKRFAITLAAAVLWCAVTTAVPAKPGLTFTHVQSDGSTVALTMQGGKFNHRLVTLDGLAVQQDCRGDYCYVAEGALSNMRAHDQGCRGVRETAFITVFRDRLTNAAAARSPRHAEGTDGRQVPCTGSPRIPIILANYADVKFIHDDPKATFEHQFNTMERSCFNYFKDQSHAQFTPQFDILGPVDLPGDREWYGANDRQGYDLRLGTMIVDACEALDADVDFSRYDNDGDGFADVVVVLYAGVGEQLAYSKVPESVWPCQWDLDECYEWGYSSRPAFPLDGVTIDKFAVFNELSGSSNASTSIDGVGTFCHEFGHCLGLPDFYPTNSGNGYGMGSWDIMDHGCYLDNSHTPAGYTSYERWFMEWIDLTVAQDDTRYTLSPLGSDSGNAVKVVNDANPNEYYLLEYRRKTGWDAFLSAEGILVIHVDYDEQAWLDNSPNNVSSHQRMTIIPADAVCSGATAKGDTWPRNGLDSLTNLSVPAAAVFTGGYMNKPLTEMKVDAAAQVASFWCMRAPRSLAGDVNGDGEVNIADINAVIDCILGGSTAAQADVNGDGEVNIADVNAIIDKILTHNYY